MKECRRHYSGFADPLRLLVTPSLFASTFAVALFASVTKQSTCIRPGLLQPLEVRHAVWADIAMDFVEGFPKVAGKSVILIVVDRFFKYAHFIPVGHSYTTTFVALAFFNKFVRLHGLPHSIVSDRDPVFTSNFWQELFRLSGCELCLSSTFHPQTDGKSEVTNRIIMVYLRFLAGDRLKSWLRWRTFLKNNRF